MNDLSSFEIKWCSRNVLCSVYEGMIFFAVKELFVKCFFGKCLCIVLCIYI